MHDVPDYTARAIERAEESGVRLIVEIDLTLKQFRALADLGLGYESSDADVIEYIDTLHRRLLPKDHGSFCGFGADINEIVRDYLDERSQ